MSWKIFLLAEYVEQLSLLKNVDFFEGFFKESNVYHGDD